VAVRENDSLSSISVLLSELILYLYIYFDLSANHNFGSKDSSSLIQYKGAYSVSAVLAFLKSTYFQSA